MTWGFNVTLRSWPTGWPYGNLPEKLRPTQPLYSSTFVDVHVSKEIKHPDGSVTPWHLVVGSPWFYFVFVNKDELRKAVTCLDMLLR
jgi:hypothetical protein